MEPLHGVIPGAFVQAVPQSLHVFPVPGQEETTALDLNKDKEEKKSKAMRLVTEALDKNLPPEMRVSMHAELRVLMVRIVNQYGDTLRELPPERTLDMVAELVAAMRDREAGQREAISESIDALLNHDQPGKAMKKAKGMHPGKVAAKTAGWAKAL